MWSGLKVSLPVGAIRTVSAPCIIVLTNTIGTDLCGGSHYKDGRRDGRRKNKRSSPV
ncbi:MAG: hypothetical protein LBI60_06985 [Bacteroidales bacterium]|nr:hypothetical protein [Bacteroidales bacterium]